MSADENQQKSEPINPLDLTFVPDWVKKPPVSIRGRERNEPNSPRNGVEVPADEKEDLVDRVEDRRRFRPSRPRGGDLREERTGGRDRKSERGHRVRGEEPVEVRSEGTVAPLVRGERTEEGRGRGDRFRGFRAPEPLPDLAVSFQPERAGLHLVARRIASAGCAFPLFQIAAFFLNQADHLSVRLSPLPTLREREGDSEEGEESPETIEQETLGEGAGSSAPMITLYQCQICRQVFRDRLRAGGHIFQRHFDRWYRQEEKEVEAPTGQFSTVVRCPLSGELLGPPNHHAFEERLLHLHRTRFSHLTLEEYRRRLENIRDPALIEEWRKSASRKICYVILEHPDQPPLESIEKVERHFQEHYLVGSIREGTSVLVPGPIARELEDPGLRRLVQEAWRKEARFPLSLSITLRVMFRRMGLHIFKTDDGTHYVTAIMPCLLEAEGTAPAIREILEFLSAHPRATRADLIAELRPGEDAGSPKVHEVITQLHWLREKGHVIEFTGGALMLPGSSIRRVQPAHREEKREGRRPRSGRDREGKNA